MKTKSLSNNQYNAVAFGPLLIIAGGLVWSILDLTTSPYYQISFYIGMVLIIPGILAGVYLAVDFQSRLNTMKNNQDASQTSIDSFDSRLEEFSLRIQILEIRNELDILKEELRRNYFEVI